MAPKSPGRATYDRNLTPDERDAEQRRRILGAAAHAFESKRADLVTLDDIAAFGEVSRTTIYKHFAGGLEELRRMAFEHHGSALTMKALGAATAPGVEDALAAALEVITDELVRAPGKMAFLVNDLGLLCPEIEAQRARVVDTLAAVWLQAHAAAFANGQTPHAMSFDDVYGFLSMLRGCVTVAVEQPTPELRRARIEYFLATYRRVHPFTLTPSSRDGGPDVTNDVARATG
jgi:AcrR family transcriptional regulator